MKKLSNLKEAQKLNKEEQKTIFGGKAPVAPPSCVRFYLSDPDGNVCLYNAYGLPGTVMYFGGIDFCC